MLRDLIGTCQIHLNFVEYHNNSFLQSEKAGKDIIMNCKTNGLPPSYIYFIFRNNKTEGINVTDELSKQKMEIKPQFTR